MSYSIYLEPPKINNNYINEQQQNNNLNQLKSLRWLNQQEAQNNYDYVCYKDDFDNQIKKIMTDTKNEILQSKGDNVENKKYILNCLETALKVMQQQRLDYGDENKEVSAFRKSLDYFGFYAEIGVMKRYLEKYIIEDLNFLASEVAKKTGNQNNQKIYTFLKDIPLITNLYSIVSEQKFYQIIENNKNNEILINKYLKSLKTFNYLKQRDLKSNIPSMFSTKNLTDIEQMKDSAYKLGVTSLNLVNSQSSNLTQAKKQIVLDLQDKILKYKQGSLSVQEYIRNCLEDALEETKQKRLKYGKETQTNSYKKESDNFFEITEVKREYKKPGSLDSYLIKDLNWMESEIAEEEGNQYNKKSYALKNEKPEITKSKKQLISKEEYDQATATKVQKVKGKLSSLMIWGKKT